MLGAILAGVAAAKKAAETAAKVAKSKPSSSKSSSTSGSSSANSPSYQFNSGVTGGAWDDFNNKYSNAITGIARANNVDMGTASDMFRSNIAGDGKGTVYAGGGTPTAQEWQQMRGDYDRILSGIQQGGTKSSKGSVNQPTQQTYQQPTQQTYQQPAMQLDPRVSNILDQLEKYLNNNKSSMDDIMGSDAYKQLESMIRGQSDQAMRGARAQLAAAGVLGEGSTPAAEKFAQVGAREGQAMAGLIPQLMGIQQNQYNSGLQNLLAQLNAVGGAQGQAFNQGITEFNTLAPYLTQTINDQVSSILQADQIYGGATGWNPTSGNTGTAPSQGQSGGNELILDVRGYVSQNGGTVDHQVINGRHVVYVNGKPIDVLAVGGRIDGGRAMIPQSYIDAALGV